MTPARVVKRDGREVPFDEGKIRSAVERAMASAGEEDPTLCSDVAALVRLTLEQRYDQRPLPRPAGGAEEPLAEPTGERAPSGPHIEEIQDLVEQALIELGRSAVAKAYIVYRDRRARIREALLVRAEPARLEAADLLTVHDSHSLSRWNKGRIVAALMGEAELGRQLSEKIAARVEARVVALSLRRISTALIRELVDCELVELGLERALRRQTSVGVPLYDLRRLLSEPPPPLDPLRAESGEALCERGSEARLAAEVLRRQALLELLPEALVERHLGGDLELVGLSALHRPLALALPCELLLDTSDVRATDAYALLEPLSAALLSSSQAVVLEDAGELVGALASRPREGAPDEALVAWLCALGATAHAAGRRLDLAGLEGRAPYGARRLGQLALVARALDAAAPSAWLPRLFVDADALERLGCAGRPGIERALCEALDRLLAGGRLVPTWSGAGERVVGPGCTRHSGERAALSCGCALALNLPRLALRAGPWREERMLEGLSELVAQGVQSLAAVAALERRAFSGQAGSGAPRARHSHGVVPVGLREALAFLGDGEVRPEQGARLLGFLAEHLRALSARHRLVLTLTPFFGERASGRFARLDREAPQHAQGVLFERGPLSAREPERPYTAGFRLGPLPGCAPWSAEATLLSTVAAGALHPLPEGGIRPASVSLGAALVGFTRLRAQGGDGADAAPAAPCRAGHAQAAELYPHPTPERPHEIQPAPRHPPRAHPRPARAAARRPSEA